MSSDAFGEAVRSPRRRGGDGGDTGAARPRDAGGALGAAALAALVDRVGRRSGATDEEVAARLPGDAIVAAPMWRSTRAVTVRAEPADIWPWLAQMGFPRFRAGWYTPTGSTG